MSLRVSWESACIRSSGFFLPKRFSLRLYVAVAIKNESPQRAQRRGILTMDMHLLFKEKMVKSNIHSEPPLKNGRFLSKQWEVLNFGDLTPFVATT
ncbi:MAG TPA: hypothetical protein VJ440_01145 [Candidatus Brocadiaceae bacterium]|nr:hypothetical protein [Candidatus Brocadiaceae bacterium]